MGAIHEAIRRLNEQPCRVCSFADRTKRGFMAVTYTLEFPKPGTPESEKVILCEQCYRPTRTWQLICLEREAEQCRRRIIPLDHQLARG